MKSVMSIILCIKRDSCKKISESLGVRLSVHSLDKWRVLGSSPSDDDQPDLEFTYVEGDLHVVSNALIVF